MDEKSRKEIPCSRSAEGILLPSDQELDDLNWKFYEVLRRELEDFSFFRTH